MTRDERRPQELNSHASRLPITTLISDVAGEAGNLISNHGALLKSEMRQQAVIAGSAGAFVAVGGLVFGIGLLLLLIGSVYLLQALAPDLPFWACWFINGGAFLIVGALALYFGIRRFTALSVVPERTIHSLKESIRCVVNLRK